MTAIKERLRTEYPCCKRASMFHIRTALPRERFDRDCRCGRRWSVDIAFMAEPIPGMTVRTLTWTDKSSDLYTNHYGGTR